MGMPVEPVSAVGALKEWYEYWRKFRGKRLRLILKSIAKADREVSSTLEIWREIMEGTVEAVQKYPPGFIMKDCEQFLRHERNYAMYAAGGKTEPLQEGHYIYDSDKRTKFAKKFVSFYIIETIEFP